VRAEVDNIFSVFYLMLYFAIFISTIGIAIIMLLIEACFMGVIGFLVGLPSGLLLLKSATSTTTITGFWLPYIVLWSTIAQAFVLALIASLGGALYPALRASRMGITQVLQQR
jgi:ABC-type antimicrobial peptide transport system permease subunit